MNLLDERNKTHGDFGKNAEVSQAIKRVFRAQAGWENLSDVQKESLEMIALKLSRILSGHADFKDHWDDIEGYARLAGRAYDKTS